MSDLQPAYQPPPAGWYAEPTTGAQRWWDGAQWGAYAPAPQHAPPQTVLIRPLKDTGIAYLLAIFLGGFGAHHFYVGNIGSGIALVVLTFVGWSTSWLLIGIPLIAVVGVWLIVDLFLIPGYVRTANAKLTGPTGY